MTATTAPRSFHSAARGGLANVGGALVSGVANLLLVVVVTRSLSAAQAGAVFAATSVFLLAAMGLRLGADTAVVHFLAGARGRGRPQDTVAYLRVALLPVAAIGAIGGAVLALVGSAVLDLVTEEAAVPHGRALMAILGAAVPVAALYDVAVAATRGLGATAPTVALERFLRPLLQVAFIGIAVAAGGSAFAVVCAWTAPYAIAAVLAGLWLLRLIPRERADAAAVDAGAFWRFTGPRALTGVVQIALQRLDILLVGAMRGATAAAVYTAATRLVVVGQIATQAVWFAVQPHLAMLVASDDVDDARGLYRISTAWLVALTWPVFLASLVAAPEIMRLFGHGYSSGASSMAVLAVAMLVSGACGIVDVVLITVGKTATSLANTALALGVNVALDLALIPELGVLGAAIGWAVAIVVRNVAALVQVRRYGDFRPLSGLAVRVAGEAAVCFAAAPALALLVFGSHPSVAVAAVGVGALAYGVRLSRIRRELHLDIV